MLLNLLTFPAPDNIIFRFRTVVAFQITIYTRHMFTYMLHWFLPLSLSFKVHKREVFEISSINSFCEAGASPEGAKEGLISLSHKLRTLPFIELPNKIMLCTRSMKSCHFESWWANPTSLWVPLAAPSLWKVLLDLAF